MLPAKLTAMEEYFLHDDQPAYPKTVLVRMRFVGRLDKTAFEAAVQEVVDRHGLLHSKVRVVGASKRWTRCDGWRVPVEWRTVNEVSDQRLWPNAGFIDIREEPGTRVFVTRMDEFDEVILQVHHCAGDARGLCRMTHDLMIAYGHHYHGPESSGPKPPEVDEVRFRHRGMPLMPRWRFLLMFHRWKARTVDCMNIFRNRCSPILPTGDLAKSLDSTSKPSEGPSLQMVRFDRAQTKGIVETAKRQSVTVNSVLLRDLYLALRDWRNEEGCGSEDDRLRLCLPVDLRTDRDADLTVVNSISLLFMDRTLAELESPDSLLASIQHELHGRKMDLRASFITMLQVARWLPGGIRRFVDDGRCWATCVVSSLGVLFRDSPIADSSGCLSAGNVRLEEWNLVTPMRKDVGLTICPYTYAGRLSMVVNYDPARLKKRQLSRLLEIYLSYLERSVGISSGKLVGSLRNENKAATI